MTETQNAGRRFPEDYSIAELHAMATRALASGDEYSRSLLCDQLREEEFRIVGQVI